MAGELQSDHPVKRASDLTLDDLYQCVEVVGLRPAEVNPGRYAGSLMAYRAGIDGRVTVWLAAGHSLTLELSVTRGETITVQQP